MVSKVFSSYHDSGIVITSPNEVWICLDDETTKFINKIIEEAIKNPSKHKK